MQQDAGPAWPQHNFHLPRRRFPGVELDDCLPGCFLGKRFWSFLRQEMLNAYAASAAGLSPGGVLSRFGNTKYGETRERLDVGGVSAVRADHQDLAKLVRICSPHLRNTRIISAGGAVSAHDQIQLGDNVRIHRWRRDLIKLVSTAFFESLNRLLGWTPGDQGSSACRAQNSLWRQIVGIGVSGAVPGEHPHSASSRNTLGCGLHNGLINADGGGGQVFKIEIGIVAARRERLGKIALQISRGDSEFLKEKVLVLSHVPRYWMHPPASKA